MKKLFYIFNFAFLIFNLTACYTPRYVYSPSAHNVPVLTQKGDSKLAFNYSANLTGNTTENTSTKNTKGHGYDLQAAHALSNHWAVMVNYFNRKERNSGNFDAGNRDSVTILYRRSMIEIAAGYYTILADNKQAIFQVFGGIGFGKSNFTDEGRNFNSLYRTRYHNMDVTKFFVQPAFMIRSKNNFAASFSSRMSLIIFKNIKTDYDAVELDKYKLDSLTISPRLFWEPAVVNTFGFKKLPGLQFEFQLGMAFLVSQRFVDYRSFNFSAGILLDLPKLLKKKTLTAKN
jgi:hypothetical protein